MEKRPGHRGICRHLPDLGLSLIGYNVCAWLLSAASPARIGTCAFVSPLVAVVLGWSLGGEAPDSRVVVSAAIILGGVALIITDKLQSQRGGRHASIRQKATV